MSSTGFLAAHYRAFQLHRALKQAVRREVEKSPELHEEWRRRRRRTLWRRALEVILILVGTPMIALSAGMMILMLAASLMGLPSGRPIWNGGFANPPKVALGLQSMLSLAILLCAMGSVDRSVCRAGYAEAHYPTRDKKPNRPRTYDWMALAIFGLAMLVVLAAPYVVVVLERDLLVSQVISTAFLLILQFAFLIAAAALVVAFNPTSSRARGFLAAIGAILLANIVFSVRIHELPDANRVAALLYVLPTGWIGATFIHAVLEEQTAGWLFLAPVAVVVVIGGWMAYAFWRSEYVLGDFIKRPNNTSVATLRGGFRVPKCDQPAAGHEAAAPPLHEGAEEVCRAAVQRLISADHLLMAHRSKRAAFIERLSVRMLSTREKTVLESWSGRYASSTGQWWWTCIALGVALGLIVVGYFAWGGMTLSIVAILGVGALAIAQIYGEYRSPHHIGAHAVRVIGQLPIRFEEVGRGLLKLELVRALFWLPLLMTYGMVGAVLSGMTFVSGILFGLGLQLLIIASLPVGACSRIAYGTDDRTARLWQLTWFTFYGVLVIPIVTVSPALEILGLVDVNTVPIIAACLYLTVAPVMTCVFLWNLKRGRIDLVKRSNG